MMPNNLEPIVARPMRHRSRLRLFSIASLLFAACSAEPDAALRVGDLAFTEEQVASLAAEQRQTLLDLAAFAAADRDSATDRLIQPLAERAADRELLGMLPLEVAAREMGLDSAALREVYARNPEPLLTVRHMVRLAPTWASEADQAAARRVAEQVRERAAAGEDFAALAAEFSEEPGAAARGGRLEPGREGTWVAPFWNAAQALAVGDVSPVVETQYGFHVLKLDAREAAPFAGADRQRLLAAAVPPSRAAAAMQQWAEQHARGVVLHPPAIVASHQLYVEGVAPETLVLAEWPGGRYTARDFALDAAALDAGELAELREADDARWGARVQSLAIDAMWIDAARALGAERSESALDEATRDWQTRVARWRGALGIDRSVGPETASAELLSALRSAEQEARIARPELAALRPLLRELYPPSGAAIESSSEAVNSDSTR